MKKVLFVATVLKKHILAFHLPALRMLKEAGYETYVAASNDTGEETPVVPYCDHYIPMPFERSPFQAANLKAYRMLKALVKQEQFDLVHCHTPVGGVVTRLACRGVRKRGTRVFYTAHGFHFYKGAPRKNWLIYYAAEKLCARYTDVLLTINEEDFALAKAKLKAGRVEYIPGVGVDLSRFGKKTGARAEKRAELGVGDGQTLLLSVGELNENKNHETVLRALPELPFAVYAVAGVGPKEEELRALAESLGVGERFRLLGYRSDVKELYEAADVFVFPSFREGLSVAVMEAMASGLPVVASRIRGNMDLIDDEGGRHFDPHSTGRRPCRHGRLQRKKSGSLRRRPRHGKASRDLRSVSLGHIKRQKGSIYGTVTE